MAKRSKKRHPVRVSKSEQELQRIENFLGEDFESLTQAKKALASETGQKRYKKSYTVGELSSRKNKTVKAFLTDVDNNRDAIDLLKHKEDFWAAEIYGNKTYSLFTNAKELVKLLQTYRGLQEDDPKKALQGIKVLRVSGVSAVDQYFKATKAQKERTKKRAKDRWKQDRRRRRHSAAKIKKLQRQIRELKKKLRSKVK